jgi:hypothetical protein
MQGGQSLFENDGGEISGNEASDDDGRGVTWNVTFTKQPAKSALLRQVPALPWTAG